MNDQSAVPFDADIPYSPPLTVVSKLGAILGHCNLCDCFGQNYASVVCLPFSGGEAFGSESVIAVRC